MVRFPALWRRPAGRIHDARLRRVATRLALQTVALVMVMLLGLELVVYLITQQTLVGSLQTTLRTRAGQADPSVCAAFHLVCGGAGGGPGPQGNPPDDSGRFGNGNGGGTGGGIRPGGPFQFIPVSGPSDASAAYIDPNLHVVHSDGNVQNIVLDPTEVREVLALNRPQCCDGVTYKGQEYLVYTAPIRNNGAAVGAVQTSISEYQYEHTLNSLLQALLVVAILGLITSGVVSLVLVTRALQPIRLAMQRQREFVADAAHELRTPLAIQRTVGEVGMSDLNADDLQATVAQMLGENQHLTRLVEDLSLLARADTNTVAIERGPVDLSALVTETVGELEPLAAAQNVTLAANVMPGVRGSGDILRLRQLLLILLDNALKHTPAGGSVSVRLSTQGDRARLQVADSGPGIAPADMPHIFDRFYRADASRAGAGSGLGLAIGKWIVEAHGGHVQAGNTAPHGAVFTVTLPYRATLTAAGAPSQPSPS